MADMKKSFTYFIYPAISFLILPFFYLDAHAQIINTVAGGGQSSGVQATQVAMSYPIAAAFDVSGNLYVVNNGDGTVRKITTSGIITTVAGGGIGDMGDGVSATSGRLRNPSGIAIDGTGNLYITELTGQKVRKVDTSGIISTVAGSGVQGYNGDGIAATSAALNLPLGVAVDGSGNIYIADLSNNRIRKVNGSGIITTVAGNGIGGYNGDGIAATSAQLNGPIAVAVDGSGNLFIGDPGNHRVRMVNTSGTITTLAGTGVAGGGGDGGPAASAQLGNPTGILVDISGNLFIADNQVHRVRQVSTSGIIITLAGTGVAGFSGDGGVATDAQLNAPFGIAIDGSGNLFIADETNHRVREVDTSGIISTVAGNGANNPNGDGGPAINAIFRQPATVFVDRAGNIYIPDSHRVRKVDPQGIITTIAGTGIAGYSGDGGMATNAQISYPFGIYADPNGNVYIGCNGDNHIRKVDSSGRISTFAGNGTNGYAGDGGPATSASIAGLQGITGDAAGNIYFTDFFNGVVRKIDTSGIISTIAGTGTYGYSGDGGPATSAQLGAPNGISMDGAGNIYIGDDAVNSIRKINTFGIISTVAGGSSATGNTGDGGPATSALFGDIESVVSDAAGNLYIVDALNNRVRRVDAATGIISAFAGNGTKGFAGDGGAAISAEFSSPWGICQDTANNLYIADANNKRIRKVTVTNSLVTTKTTVNQTRNAPYSTDINDNNYHRVVLYPNPVHDKLFVQVQGGRPEKMVLQLADMQGRVLQQQEVQLSRGTTSLSFNTAGLPAGSYLLISWGDRKMVSQFIKK